MSKFEFSIIPAPYRTRKLKGLKRGEDKFCATLTDEVTSMGLDGWEFVRFENVPQVRGLTGLFTKSRMRTVMVFRRAIERLVDQEVTDTRVLPRRVVAQQEPMRAEPFVAHVASTQPAH